MLLSIFIIVYFFVLHKNILFSFSNVSVGEPVRFFTVKDDGKVIFDGAEEPSSCTALV